jgi:winged helix DNA-binding protein
VSVARVLQWRIARQFLAAAKGVDAVAVARRVCGVHAQLAESAVMSTRLRARIAYDAVERALFDDRTLVKTWAARGTLHLLPAADLSAWVAVMSTPERRATLTWPPDPGMTAEEMADLLAALPGALGRDAVTRQELADRVLEGTGHEHLRAAITKSWGGVLKPAAHLGLLCFGPPRGRNVTFVSPSAWLPNFSTGDGASRTEALDALALAYLSVYGPADIEQFCDWVGVGGPQARQTFTRLGDRLAYVDVDGTSCAIRREHLPDLLDSPEDRVVRLLPAFDPYVVGSLRQLQRMVVGGERNARLVSRAQGWISPVLVVNGRILGTWTREHHRIVVAPFAPLPRATRFDVRVATDELDDLYSDLQRAERVRSPTRAQSPASKQRQKG